MFFFLLINQAFFFRHARRDGFLSSRDHFIRSYATEYIDSRLYTKWRYMALDMHYQRLYIVYDKLLVNTYHALSVAVLSGHREIESEEFAVAHVYVTRLRTSESVDSSVERLVRLYLYGDPRVLTIDDN